MFKKYFTMNKALRPSKFIRETSKNILLYSSASVFGLIFWLFASNFFSPERVGIAVTLINLIQLTTLLSRLEINHGILRFFPPNSKKINTEKAARMFSQILILLFLASMTFSTLIAGLSLVLNLQDFSSILDFKDFSDLFFFSFLIILNTLFTVYDSIFLLNKNFKILSMKIISLHTIRLSLIFVLGIVFLGNLVQNEIFFAWIVSLVIVSGILTIFLIVKYSLYKFIDFNFFQLKSLLKYSFTTYIEGIVFKAFDLGVPIIIALIFSPTLTAYYSIAWQIMAGFLFLPFAINSVFVANINTKFSTKKDIELAAVAKDIKEAFLLQGTISLSIAALIVLFSPLILTFYGSLYLENSKIILTILALTFPFYAVNRFFFTLERIQLHLRNVIVLQTTVILIAFILAYLCLILHFTVISFAIGWFIGNFLVFVYTIFRFLKIIVLK